MYGLATWDVLCSMSLVGRLLVNIKYGGPCSYFVCCRFVGMDTWKSTTRQEGPYVHIFCNVYKMNISHLSVHISFKKLHSRFQYNLVLGSALWITPRVWWRLSIFWNKKYHVNLIFVCTGPLQFSCLKLKFNFIIFPQKMSDCIWHKLHLSSTSLTLTWNSLWWDVCLNEFKKK